MLNNRECKSSDGASNWENIEECKLHLMFLSRLIGSYQEIVYSFRELVREMMIEYARGARTISTPSRLHNVEAVAVR